MHHPEGNGRLNYIVSDTTRVATQGETNNNFTNPYVSLTKNLGIQHTARRQ
ncbi:hypothetical protein PAHAL_9G110800 [Panicum hallii]|uniref:Uncharacterized protein n=1 Tax=Panicum hallii TaxID=206008 RepID=A0A2T8I0V2_9POAL|nr:hypothetical protein PAHAL_9G110800 [Panicum hallii]